MKKNIFNIFSLIIVAFFISCSSNPDINNATMLDGTVISDPSLADPGKYLISSHFPTPTNVQKSTPVIICAHGYTATTFEWDELRTYADSAKTFYVSQVLLGGHGRTYADFKKATWHDWQSSIMEEYQKLSSLGFKNIYLAGSSTGAPLIVNMVQTGFFSNFTTPKGIFLVDPIIVSSNKTLTLVGLLGPLLGYLTTDLSTGEQGHWYVYRPQETLKQLQALIDLTRLDLERGITLPAGTYMKVYKSKSDATADPISALMIYKGMKTSTGGNIDVELVNSDLHVFTRLHGRDTITTDEVKLQQATFKKMEMKMTE
jgi:carboxylesterase